MSAHERTGWRDQEISARHRRWGVNCPAADLDFLMVEYNHGLPVALVEYKHHRVKFPIDLRHATYRAIRALADGAGLPFLLAFYWPETWAFYVVPVNDIAAKYITPNRQRLSEQEFVRGLYRLRKMAVEARVIAGLNATDLPADAALPSVLRDESGAETAA